MRGLHWYVGNRMDGVILPSPAHFLSAWIVPAQFILGNGRFLLNNFRREDYVLYDKETIGQCVGMPVMKQPREGRIIHIHMYDSQFYFHARKGLVEKIYT